MARLKYADALVKTPKLDNHKQWNQIRQASQSIVRVSEILPEFSPDQFLLTHATIVASVDVEANDYYITPQTSKYVNQNADSWERRLLLATFNSFIGGQNYLEHVQIPHLSKGRIIDAVARPVNNDESIYIDILVATNRKHRDLVANITSGKMSTLSMGCSIKYSYCSKCGNKAADETDLCDCVRYLKGAYFIDQNGTKRIIAELCGHRDEPESNQFIEASWVENPAFKGAVLRNIILAQGEDISHVASKIEEAYTHQNKQADSIDGFLKAASVDQLNTFEKKISAVRQARTIISNAGLNWEGFQADDSQQEQQDDPNDHSELHSQFDDVLSDKNQPEQEEAPIEVSPVDTMPIDQIPDTGVPMSGQQAEPQYNMAQPSDDSQPVADDQPEQEEAQPEAPAPEDQTQEAPPVDEGAPVEDPNAQPPMDDPSMAPQDPNAMAAPAPESPADSFEGMVNEIKREIRQQIIDDMKDDLLKYMDSQITDYTDTDMNQGWNQNENLIQAFVEVYQPRTGFSKSKLASIFKMIQSYENRSDFTKYAYNTNDLIDFFQFVDTYQLSENGLKTAHYQLLRNAGSREWSDLNAFNEFLENNGITNKAVIKSLITKVSFIRDFLKKRRGRS